MLRNNVRLSNYPFVPAFLERVEVLRGPGAALGLRSGPAATVNLAIRRPQRVNFLAGASFTLKHLIFNCVYHPAGRLRLLLKHEQSV